MRTLKLVVEYDGGRYAGWQRQENAITVQEELERALAILLRHPVTVHGAGRTDAGVHARGQVASLTTTSADDAYTILGGLNGLLPEDIAAIAVEDVPESFHARFSAVARRYSYTLSLQPAALLRRHAWQVRYRLDEAALEECAALLAGTMDFRSFCRAQSDVAHHRCTIREARWERRGPLLVLHITADRFLHGMVRTIVGTMVDVARGYRAMGDYRALFDVGDRREAGPAAPPQGLVLEEVYYS